MMKRMTVIPNQKKVKVKSHPVPKKAVRAKIRICSLRIILRKNDGL
jgi:hypothetical protein